MLCLSVLFVWIGENDSLSSTRSTATVARSATYLFIQGFANAVLGLLYFAVLTRVFSADADKWQMGAFGIISLVLALASTFGTFALPSASIKYVAQYLAEDNVDKAKAVVVRVFQVSLLAAVVVFLVLFIPAETLGTMLLGRTGYGFLIQLLALCGVFTVLNLQAAGFLQGMQRMRDVALLGILYSAVSFVLGAGLLLSGMISSSVGLYAIVIGWLIGLFFSSVGGILLTSHHLGVLGKPAPINALMRFSFPLYVSGGISFFVSWIDQILLVTYMSLLYGPDAGQTIYGVYYVAIRASIVPALLSNAIVSTIFPKLSELYAQQGTTTSLKDAFRVSTRYSVLIGFPLIVGIAALAYPVIILFGGWAFVGATQPLIILSIAALVGALSVGMGPILLTLERTTVSSVLSLISVALSFSLAFTALVPLNLGMLGTAWGRTLAATIMFLINVYVVRRYIPVSFDRESILKASIASVFMVLAIFLLDAIRWLLSPSSYEGFLVIHLTQLPIYVVVGALAYFFTLIGLKGIKKQDVELFQDYLPQRLRWIASWLNRIVSVN